MTSRDDDRAGRLHPLLRRRYSPLAFDPDVAVDAGQVDLLLEAARWSPSAGNSQPWAFVTAVRGTAEHAAVTARLVPSTARWAPSASLLVVNIAHRHVDDTDLEFSEFADYDLGQAVAHMTIQAEALGLASRQFRAFDLEGLTAHLGLAPGWEVRSITAFGRAVGEAPARDRRPLADLRHVVSGPGRS
ncbi:MAG TPA: nitroreductase family protein [Nocardioides sp.]|nr:nitroreductase family protein [Nocardioides sp.]